MPHPSPPSPMASLFHLSLLLVVILASSASAATTPHDAFALGEPKKTHLHFFFHDKVSKPNATALLVAPTSTVGVPGFGSIFVINDALTEGPERSSKLIGKAQGIYAIACPPGDDDFGLLMTLNYAFVDGEFKGSSLAILGRNPVLSDVREMPVVGGSGRFRMARGYALAHTHWYNPANGDAIVEYNVYVIHH